MTAWRLFRSGKFGEIFVRSLNTLNNPSVKHEVDYTKWHKTWVDLNDHKRNQILANIESLPQRPSFALFLFVDAEDSNPSLFFQTIQSVRAQLYPDWVLFIVNDSPNAPLDPDFSEKIESLGDSRIKVNPVATSEVPYGWVCVLPSETQLHEAALFIAAVSLIENSQTEIMYCDHDHLNVQGEFCDPHMKPEWNPDLFAAMNYMAPLVICKRDLWEHRSWLANEYDFLLNVTKTLSSEAILRMPYVLASVRISDDRSHLAPPVRRIEYDVPTPAPLVSILIPTRDQGKMLQRCLNSIYEKTSYSNFEIVLVDHQSSEKNALKVIESYRDTENFQLVDFSGHFNFSAMMNRAAVVAKGRVLILLNNDTEIIEPEWLTELVSQVSRPEVGIVGALLLFGDESIQHAGVHPGVGGLMGHGHKHLPGDSSGYFNRLKAVHEVAAVTGACLAIEKSTWVDLGGLDEENLAVAYNDIDLCFKVRKEGLRIIFTPFARLLHHESVSRGVDSDPSRNQRLNSEIKVMNDRWGDMLESDPAYSPNLNSAGAGFNLSEEPRILPFWKNVTKSKT